MKIGILTLPLHTNYGGILQVYALQTILERMGHDVVVLNREREYSLPLWRLPLSYTKRIIKKYILRKKDVRIFQEQYDNKVYAIVSQHTQKFIDTYIHTYNIESFKSLKSIDFDAIVVGSDQVWRPKYFTYLFNASIENAFLSFARKWNIKRISYAASFGTEDWEYSAEDTDLCGELLKLFNVVTVREESAVRLCKEKLGVEASHVLDPTMLLSKEDYIKLFDVANTPKSSGNLLTYILDDTPEKIDLINKIAKTKGLTPFRVNSKSKSNASAEERIQPPVEAWLRGFYDAEFVVTDSFHACVFSIIFGKPFVVIGNKDRGMARFESLLKMFGLEDHMVCDNFDFKKINNLIDWKIVNSNKDNFREKSISVLKNSFK